MTNNEHTRRTVVRSIGAAGIASGLAGCLGGGGGDGDGGGSDGGGGDGGGDGGSMEESASLGDRARSEGNVKIGSAITRFEPFYEQYSGHSGVEVEHVRDDPEKISARFLQEISANRLTFDITLWPNPIRNIDLLSRGDVYRELDPELVEAWPGRVVEYDGAPMLLQQFVGTDRQIIYNTDLVESPPSTVDEIVEDWSGQFFFDIYAFEMLAIMRKRHGFDEGTSRIELLAEHGEYTDSVFSSAQAVARGELAMTFSFNKFVLYDFGETIEATPLEDTGRIAKVVSSGLMQNAPHPAAASYMADYMAENAADVLVDLRPEGQLFEPQAVRESDEYEIWDIPTVNEMDVAQIQDDYNEIVENA